MGKQNTVFYMILAERENIENIFKGNDLMSFTSLFLLLKQWCPIFNNKYYFAKLRCFGNAAYFSAMAIFSTRVPLFISGFKKSVSVVNERGDSLKRAFECRCFCSWMEVARKYRCLNTMCTYTPVWGVTRLYSIRHETSSRLKFISSPFN